MLNLPINLDFLKFSSFFASLKGCVSRAKVSPLQSPTRFRSEFEVRLDRLRRDDNGIASFDLIRHQRANERIFLYAFDLIELNGDEDEEPSGSGGEAGSGGGLGEGAVAMKKRVDP